MADSHGDFIWYELMTTDADAAQDFYGELLGWTFADSGTSDMDYRLGSMDGAEIVGLMALTEEMCEGGAQPMWTSYVCVSAMAPAIDELKRLGGTVLMEPNELEGVGTFAYVTDPQGAMFYLMQPADPDEQSQSFAKHEPREGHCAWNELVTEDPAGAKTFYCELFGWEKSGEMDMGGEMGLYEMYSVNGYSLGAIMGKPEMMPMSMWVQYLRVPDIDAAAEFVGANGGQVLNGPMEIPGGDFVLQGMDPQGAFFALIGTKES